MRSNSNTPVSCSSSLICLLTALCDRCKASQARETLPKRAVVVKARSR